MIAANLINLPNQGFMSDNNALTVLFDNQKIDMPLQSNHQLARELIKLIADQW